MTPTPAAPFSRWPIQSFHPEIGFTWYTEPGVFVSQATVRHGTLDAARWVQDRVDEALSTHAKRIAACGGLLIIHDLSSVKSYESEARVHWGDRIKRRPTAFARAAIVCVAPNPLLRMAAQGLNMLAALHVKTTVRMVSDLAPVLAEYKVIAPA